MSSAVVYMYTSNSERSLVLSSFYWGYLLGLIPSALLIRRFGAKLVLIIAVFAWSFASILTVLAYDVGIWLVIAAQVMVGLAEGANFPCQAALITAWIPNNEMSRTAAFTTSGEYIGTIVALWGGPLIIEHYGWGSLFWFSAALGFTWLIPFSFLLSDRPAGSYRGFGRDKMGIPWYQLLSSFTFWATVVTQFCFMWAYFVGVSWLPDYFEDEFGVNLNHLGFYTILPYLASFILSNIAGWIADAMIACYRKSCVRKLMNTIGCLSSALFFYLLGTVKASDDPYCTGHYCVQAVMLLTAAIATSSITFCGWDASLLELYPLHTSALVSVSFTFGTFPGIVGNLDTGVIASTSSVETEDWGNVFLLYPILLVIAAGIFLLFGERDHPILIDKDKDYEIRQ